MICVSFRVLLFDMIKDDEDNDNNIIILKTQFIQNFYGRHRASNTANVIKGDITQLHIDIYSKRCCHFCCLDKRC